MIFFSKLIVFKGKPDGYKEKILKSNKYVKSKKIFAFTQEKSWVDNNIFNLLLDNVFFKYFPNNAPSIPKILI